MLKVAWEIPGLRTLNLYQTESASITLTPKPLRQLCELYIESPLWRSKQRHLSLCLCLPSDVLHWIIDGTSTTKALLPLKYLSQSGWKEHNQGEMWKLFDHMNRENVAKKLKPEKIEKNIEACIRLSCLLQYLIQNLINGILSSY